jgi:predicted dehydrogenase
VAIGSRDQARADAFATEIGADRGHGSYDALIEDPGVEFVYVATPHPTHAELAIRAAEAGRHVLCEKPMAVTVRDAERVVEAARRSATFLTEGFAFRCHAQTRALIELVEAGEIGEVRVIDAPFGYDAGPQPTNYLFNRELAGGSILDVGCYPVAMSRLIAGRAQGRPFADPDIVAGTGTLHPEHGVDLDAAAVAWFEPGITAQLMCSIRTALDYTLRITGTHGTLTLPAAWLPGRWGGPPRIVVTPNEGEERIIPIDATGGLYTIEADTVVARAREGRMEAPEMTWEDSLGNMRTLDRWRSAVGVSYPDDERG